MDLKSVILMFIIAIVGIVMLGVIADKTYENTDGALANTTNVTVTVVNLVTGDDGTSTSNSFTASSIERFASFGGMWMLNSTPLTLGTDYTHSHDNLNDISTFVFLNTSIVIGIADSENNNQTHFNYYGYSPEYVQGSGAARTLLNLNALWYVLGIFLFVIAIVWHQLKKNDLL